MKDNPCMVKRCRSNLKINNFKCFSISSYILLRFEGIISVTTHFTFTKSFWSYLYAYVGCVVPSGLCFLEGV